MIPTPLQSPEYAPSVYRSADGVELLTNGSFDTDTDWAKGAGWTIAGGKASKAAGAGSDLTQAGVMSNLVAQYLAETTVSGRTAGGVTTKLGTVTGTPIITNITLRELITSDGADYAQEADATFDGDVELVSLMKAFDSIARVKAALGNLFSLVGHNTNAATRYVMIFDQATAPVNGNVPALVTAAPANGDFELKGFEQWPWHFENGLYVALSTTDDVLTLAVAEAIFFAKFK